MQSFQMIIHLPDIEKDQLLRGMKNKRHSDRESRTQRSVQYTTAKQKSFTTSNKTISSRVFFAISTIFFSLLPFLCPLVFQAIKFLLEKELLNDTPEDVALYLFCNGMDKTALGDYLGEG